jgi:small subunit ribosomal protein S13
VIGDYVPGEFKHIVRLAGKDLPGNKPVQLALSYLKGVSVNYARAVAYATDIDPFAKLGSLTKEQVEQIEKAINNPSEYGIPSWMLNRRKDFDTGRDLHIIGSDLEIAIRSDIGRERHIRSRRGIRHELGLPVRGQRTRSTGRKGLVVGVKRKEIRIREEAARAKGRQEKEKPEKAEEKKPEQKT